MNNPTHRLCAWKHGWYLRISRGESIPMPLIAINLWERVCWEMSLSRELSLLVWWRQRRRRTTLAKKKNWGSKPCSKTFRSCWIVLWQQMVEQKDIHSSSPGITPKLKFAAEQPSTGECWIPPKKDTLCPRAEEKPQQDGRRGKITFRIKPLTHQRRSEGSNKSCVRQDPETSQRLSQNCFWVSPAKVWVCWF